MCYNRDEENLGVIGILCIRSMFIHYSLFHLTTIEVIQMGRILLRLMKMSLLHMILKMNMTTTLLMTVTLKCFHLRLSQIVEV